MKAYLSEFKSYIEITTRIGCPNDCAYCPQHTLSKAYKSPEKQLELQDFSTILKNIPKNVQIDFGGMTEPFANPKTAEMILLAHERGHQIMLYTTLRGFCKEDIHRLKNIPFVACVVHTVDRDGLIKYVPDLEYFEKIKLLKELKYRNLDFMVIGNPRSDIEEVIGHPLESTKILTRCGELESGEFVGISKNIMESRHHSDSCVPPPQIICGSLIHNRSTFRPTLAERTVMLPNGDIVLCCMDYSLKHIVGNLKQSSYKEIINSVEMHSIENAMLGRSKMDLLCRRCEWAVPYHKFRWLRRRLVSPYLSFRLRFDGFKLHMLPILSRRIFKIAFRFFNFKIDIVFGNVEEQKK